jgi:hypothetical protein
VAETPSSLGSTVSRTAIATIVAAAVGGVITWAGGWFPALWEGFKTAAVWTWALFTYPVAVPLAILVVLALPWAVLGAAWVANLFEKKAPPAAAAEAPLGELELRLLGLLARADGRYLNFDDAAERLQTSRLLLQRACEGLAAREFIEPHRDVLHGVQLLLTREGREFVIKEGFPLGSQRTW